VNDYVLSIDYGPVIMENAKENMPILRGNRPLVVKMKQLKGGKLYHNDRNAF